MPLTMIRGLVVSDRTDLMVTDDDKLFVSFAVRFNPGRDAAMTINNIYGADVHCTAIGETALHVRELALTKGTEVKMCGNLWYGDGMWFMELQGKYIDVVPARRNV